MAEVQQRPRVFVSYKSSNKEFARRLATDLRGLGIFSWLDDWNLPPGEPLTDAMEEGILRSDTMLLLLTRDSVNSIHAGTGGVAYEVHIGEGRRFRDSRFRIIGVYVEKCDPPEKLRNRIGKWIDFSDPKGYGATLAQLAAWIKNPKADLGPPIGGFQGPEMVVILPDRFEMGDLWGDGDKWEKPVHPVQIFRPFALGRYAVTFHEYDMFAVATGTELPADEGWGRGRRPVINVSWEDAVTYAEWLSHHTGKRYRLPSEAEWEYAARSGGKEEKWAGTSTEGELGNYAWHFYNSGRQSHPVGMKKTNGLGLYDMSGNVYEWIEDWWNGGYKGAPDDGSVWKSGDSEFRVMRGGCWYNLPRGVRSVYRYGNALHLRHKSIGFRLAQDL